MTVKRNISILILLLIIGGVAWLDLKEIPAPQHPIEKVIANERLLK